MIPSAIRPRRNTLRTHGGQLRGSTFLSGRTPLSPRSRALRGWELQKCETPFGLSFCPWLRCRRPRRATRPIYVGCWVSAVERLPSRTPIAVAKPIAVANHRALRNVLMAADLQARPGRAAASAARRFALAPARATVTNRRVDAVMGAPRRAAAKLLATVPSRAIARTVDAADAASAQIAAGWLASSTDFAVAPAATASCIGANGTTIRLDAAIRAIVTATGLAPATAVIVRRIIIRTTSETSRTQRRKSPTPRVRRLAE
jgi:hypothetical protein